MSDRNSRSRRDHDDGMALDNDGRAVAGAEAKSVEGWVIMVRNVHEEADEEALTEKFADYGNIKSVRLELDRRTGYVKGYALIEYETKEEAARAIDDGNGSDFYGKELSVDYAFIEPSNRRQDRGGSNRLRRNDRSRSPTR